MATGGADSIASNPNKSGRTSPTLPRSVWSSNVARSDTAETEPTSWSRDSRASSTAGGFNPPAPPINSPAAHSTGSSTAGLDAASLLAQLRGLHVVDSNSTSSASSSSSPPQQQEEVAPAKPEDNAGEHVHEHQIWQTFAEERVDQGLQHLVTSARDRHLLDPRRTVEEHYSESVARALRDAELQFDPSFLE